MGADIYTDRGCHPSIATQSYVLADRLIVPRLKSALMDGYFTRVTPPVPWFPTSCLITYALSNLPDNDPLLRLYVDVWAVEDIVYTVFGHWKAEFSALPEEFLVRLI